MTNTREPAIGEKVGAHRWPGHGGHPDSWGRPWAGVVLERWDPRAWQGSIAFSHVEVPSKAECFTHAMKHWDTLSKEVPVLWTFKDAQGREYTKVYWHKWGSGSYDLKPYAEDLQAWMIERGESRIQARAA